MKCFLSIPLHLPLLLPQGENLLLDVVLPRSALLVFLHVRIYTCILILLQVHPKIPFGGPNVPSISLFLAI